jgi:hypothetical protein
MYPLMFLHVALITECFVAHVTRIQTLPSVNQYMPLQFAQITERFRTDFTKIRTLSSVYQVMPLEFTQMTECFITNTTRVETFLSSCGAVLIWSGLLRKQNEYKEK